MNNVEFSKDGKTLVVAGSDGDIRQLALPAKMLVRVVALQSEQCRERPVPCIALV